MVTRWSHERQSENNAEFLDHTKSCDPSKPDWVCVVAFYEAVHWIEAVFAARDPIYGHSNSHPERRERLKGDPKYRQLLKWFNRLWEVSLVARYLTFGGTDYPLFRNYLDPAGVDALLVNALGAVRTITRSMLKKLDTHAQAEASAASEAADEYSNPGE